MELIQGKTLKEIIKEDGALSWKWSVNIAIQIASALEAAHKNNIVHRDIKPHNIIITEDGIAKVTDFGMIRTMAEEEAVQKGLLHIIDSSVDDEYMAELKKQISAQFGAEPLQNQNYGKIVNAKHFDRLLGLIDEKKVVCRQLPNSAATYQYSIKQRKNGEWI